MIRREKKSPLGDWRKSVLTVMVRVMRIEVLGQAVAADMGVGRKVATSPASES